MRLFSDRTGTPGAITIAQGRWKNNIFTSKNIKSSLYRITPFAFAVQAASLLIQFFVFPAQPPKRPRAFFAAVMQSDIGGDYFFFLHFFSGPKKSRAASPARETKSRSAYCKSLLSSPVLAMPRRIKGTSGASNLGCSPTTTAVLPPPPVPGPPPEVST